MVQFYSNCHICRGQKLQLDNAEESLKRAKQAYENEKNPARRTSLHLDVVSAESDLRRAQINASGHTGHR